MPWRQGMKVCSWLTTEYVLVALCILNSLRTIQCGQCPSGWQEGPLEDHCFTFMSNAKSWNESEIACKTELQGAHLAALVSAEELRFVDSLCNAIGGCWVGGSQQQSSSQYPNWTDCQAQWNASIFPRAPTPSRNCFDASCSEYLVDGWCTVVNTSLAWEDCVSHHPYVCGLILGGSCEPKTSHRQYIIIVIVVTTVILTTTLGLTIWLLAYRSTKRRRRRRRMLATLASPASNGWKLFRYAELEAFTDSFAEANKLGEGEDVNTHRGILPDGSPVVVKKVERPSFLGERDFLAEMRRIGRLKHPNLVPLKGCCFNRGDGYIVYDYISNGTLDKWLHHLSRGDRPLDWDTRIRIATGVADILAHLHDKMRPNLAHRNVRASTVLLDDEFNPRVIGLGLVNMARGTTNEGTVIVGTHGYVAPEFVIRNELTTKSDVYSFGVLLLELVTGRKPKGPYGEESTSEPRTIFEWANPLVQAEAWTDLLDDLIGTVPNYSQVKKVVDLVYTCTQHIPAMRPRMSYVLYELQELHRAELMVFPVDRRNTMERRDMELNPVEFTTDQNTDDNTSTSDIEIREVPL